ncbi:MAG: hypothetical protein N2512_02475, partial [Armatimonadetes bacterium]|nr:hypothetical protein [Armatimonadota bacterium]
LNLLPDFGNPPLQFGGWGSPRAMWYHITASHNTVLIDRASQQVAQGTTRLWGDGEGVHLIEAAAPAVYSAPQYSRTVVLVDVSETDFYAADIFRVVGGSEHTKFVQGPPGKVAVEGLSLAPAEDFDHGALLRDLRLDSAARLGWSADFAVEDIRGYLPAGRQVRMRYTDMTNQAAAGVCEAWAAASFNTTEEYWLPRLVIQRQGEAPLCSNFVAVLQPYADGSRSPVATIRRLGIEARRGLPYGDAAVALEARLADGRRDLIVSADAENPLGRQPDFREIGSLRQPDWGLSTDAEFCFVRLSRAGSVERVALAKGSRLRVGEAVVELKAPVSFLEAIFAPRPRVVAGDQSLIKRIGFVPGAK